LNTNIPTEPEIREIIRKEGLFSNPNGTVGLNVNAYIGRWTNSSTFKREDFCSLMASVADRLIGELNVDVLFTITQIMDEEITNDCVKRIQQKSRVRIMGNKDYTYQELAAILGRLDVHAGLRTHTLILCAAVSTPMISINAYPKNLAFLETIGMGEWNISLEDLSVEKLFLLIKECRMQRHQIRVKMQLVVEEEKRKARASAGIVLEMLGY
jgi:polysaccharide pyruvyl transferase WcaK-like protein